MRMQIMKDELRQLIDNTNSRVFGQILSGAKYSDLLSWVLEESKELSEVTLKERAWYILNDKPQFTCIEGNKKTFNPKTKSYGFCNNISQCECLKKHAKETYTPRDMSVVVSKRKETWLKRYGVDNASKATSVKQKRKHTMSSKSYTHIYNRLSLDKETVGFQRVIERVSTHVIPLFTRDEYLGSSRHNKYKWECITCSYHFTSHIDYGTVPKCPICYPKTISQAEIAIASYVRSLGFEIETNTKKILGNLELDIYIPERKIAIEYNGIYWHSSFKKKPKYHVNKYLRCKEQGIHLIQIFENDWLTCPDIIKNRLCNILGKSKRIGARNCKITNLDQKTYKHFLERHHLAGYSHSTIKYGLVSNNELVAVMGFSNSRYTSEGYELVRYCSSHTVVGGAGKLLSHFKKNHDPTIIVSYADRCWSNGNLYKTLGFQEVTSDLSNVGYWYIKDNIRYHRSNFTKSRLVSMGHPADQSETEIMNALGYLKIYDCGNGKFVWSKSCTPE